MSSTNQRCTAARLLQDFAELYGSKGSIVWDHYGRLDIEAIKRKTEQILADEPIPADLTNVTALNRIVKHNEKMEALRMTILEAVWQQKKIQFSHDDSYLQCLEYTCHPLFRVRKCILDDQDTADCCMIFVDENGRVYQNWSEFKANNKIPAGKIIAPKNGIFDFDENEQVILEMYPSAAATVMAQTVETTDKVAGYLGMAAASVPLAGLAVTVAAPVMIGSLVAGVSVGAYSVARSIYNIMDRSKHEQSLSLTDREARSAWIGVGGGVLSMAAGGAVTALAKYAATGAEVSQLIIYGVNGLNVVSLAVNTVGVGNGVFEIFTKFKDDDDISGWDILQLGSSLILVTHSIYNYQSATLIVNAARDTKIASFRAGLSNRQRKMYTKLVKETIRIRGTTQGKMDIIRSLNNVPDKPQLFSDVYKVNKNLNRNNLRPSFSPDGSILINNDVAIDARTLRSTMSQKPVPSDFLTKIPSLPPSVATAAERVISSDVSLKIPVMVTSAASFIVSCYRVLDQSTLENSLDHIYKSLTREAADRLLQMVTELFEKLTEDLERKLHQFIPFEKFLWDTFNITFTLSGSLNEMSSVILAMGIEFLEQKINDFYNAFVTVGSTGRFKCKDCAGSYSIVNLENA